MGAIPLALNDSFLLERDSIRAIQSIRSRLVQQVNLRVRRLWAIKRLIWAIKLLS